jgi:hypothetical protein
MLAFRSFLGCVSLTGKPEDFTPPDREFDARRIHWILLAMKLIYWLWLPKARRFVSILIYCLET